MRLGDPVIGVIAGALGDRIEVEMVLHVASDAWEIVDNIHPRGLERIRRPDYGHIEVAITMEDSEAFTGPWTRTFVATLAPPEEEIMEFICSEGNRDVSHYRGK